MRRLILPLLGGLTLVTGTVPRPATAQADPGRPAHVAGQVLVHATDEPLAGADVTVVGRDGRWITDEEGRFVMPELEPGTVRLRVEFLGYATAEGEIEMEGGVAYQVEVRMDARAIEVEGFVVTARPAFVFRRLREARRRLESASFGYFLTRADLEARGHPSLAEALRMVPGVRVSRSAGLAWTVTFRGGCRPQIYMDGVRALAGSDLWALTTLDVEILEVYSSPAGLPPQYRDRNTHCAVLVWSRIRAPTP